MTMVKCDDTLFRTRQCSVRTAALLDQRYR
jgi:hypothetical protein